MTSEELFLTHLRFIEKVATHVARRFRFSREETEDLVSWVKQKLCEDNYGIIRKFQSKSSFRTYLTTVINHLAQDYQNHLRGKWRPSAEAKRQGPLAVLLEQLLARDGFTFDQACKILRTNHHVEEPLEKLEELAGKLPHRNPPRRMVGEEELRERPGTAPNPEQDLLNHDKAEKERKVLVLLRKVWAPLDGEDKLIVRMWVSGFKIVAIAETLRLEQKSLYRRLEKIFKALRAELEKRGVTSDDVQGILRAPEDPDGR